jgi:ESCRT-II complex subunit VPS36
VLRREGGIMSLVDLWAVFNRLRGGIELVSPLDFEKAAKMWEVLGMPVRLRRFRSGLLVVQERGRTDGKTVQAVLGWLRDGLAGQVDLNGEVAPKNEVSTLKAFGRSTTAQETAERFGWSVGVASEELEMAEDLGAVCRDQCLDGVRFWENRFQQFEEALALEGTTAGLEDIGVGDG